MTEFGIIEVAVSVRKGMTILAKGHAARIVAIAAAVGIVTFSLAIAAGAALALRTLRLGIRRISSLKSESMPRLPG